MGGGNKKMKGKPVCDCLVVFPEETIDQYDVLFCVDEGKDERHEKEVSHR
jgi:hypothetical protein